MARDELNKEPCEYLTRVPAVWKVACGGRGLAELLLVQSFIQRRCRFTKGLPSSIEEEATTYPARFYTLPEVNAIMTLILLGL